MMVPLELVVTVLLFAVVQSLFGIGLLVFGTPTLLLFGYSFEETLAFLLPSSILISLAQALRGREHLGEMRRSIVLYCVPFIVGGLSLVLTGLAAFDVKMLVGLALLLTALTRLSDRSRQVLAGLLEKNTRPYLALMGLVHGLSNMGGGFLTILVTTLHDDKERVRANVSYAYFVFALSQIGVLVLLRPGVFTIQGLILAALAFATYSTVGQLLYVKSSRPVYHHLITVFMLAYGLVLVVP